MGNSSSIIFEVGDKQLRRKKDGKYIWVINRPNGSRVKNSVDVSISKGFDNSFFDNSLIIAKIYSYDYAKVFYYVCKYVESTDNSDGHLFKSDFGYHYQKSSDITKYTILSKDQCNGFHKTVYLLNDVPPKK